MRIGINTRFLLSTKMEGFGWYTFEVSKRLVEQHPEHEFYFFFDRPYDPKFIFGKNVKPIVLSPPARHPLLFIYWFEIALKKALKKNKIDLFFSPDGYLSLGSTIPQISVIHDINFEHYPKDLPFSARIYLRKYFPLFAKKASKIITVSNYSKQDITLIYKIDPDKISVAWNGVSDVFKPLSQEEKQKIENKYTNGNPYFLFVGSLHPRKNINRLIKAFILFKQKTNSNFYLVITGESLWKTQTFNHDIPDQIKSQICFTGHLKIDELANVMGAASIFSYVPYFEGFGIPLVEAMKCGIPIIAGNKTSLPEIAADAAIYCDPFNIEEISDKMIELVSSETLREQLRQAGLIRSKQFNWDNSAEIVWKEIEQVLNKKNHPFSEMV